MKVIQNNNGTVAVFMEDTAETRIDLVKEEEIGDYVCEHDNCMKDAVALVSWYTGPNNYRVLHTSYDCTLHLIGTVNRSFAVTKL